ncbi:MAG: MFS transporter, partial [Bacteroidota bacterium]
MITRTLAVYKNSFTGIPSSVWLLSLVSFINRSGTMVLPFLTIYLTTALGFTLGQAGWAMTSFGVGSVVGSFLGGRLTDKTGYFHVQFWSLFVGGLLFILLGQFTSFWHVVAIIFTLSVVSEAYRPAMMTAVAAQTQPENRTRSYSLLRTAVNIGWSLGPAIGGWLAASFGYHALFWVDGLTCIAAAIVFRLFLHPSKAPQV